MPQPSRTTALARADLLCARCLRALCHALAGVAALALLAMIAITCSDVFLRKVFGSPIRGAYDLVLIAGAVTIAAALPYTTAVKGHVAVEYFFHKLSRKGRIVVDSFARLLAAALFVCLAWRSALYAQSLHATGRVSDTLAVPLFWIPWVIAFCAAVVALVIVYHLLHPGRELIKP